MRFGFGALVFASALPAGAVRFCADTPTVQVFVGDTRVKDVRVGCFATPWNAAHANLLRDTLIWTPTVAWSGRCILYAFRRDGALWTRSAPAAYSPGHEVEVRFPPGRAGGIGIAIDPNPEWGKVTVLRVQPGSPADGQLRPGDNVVAVDGKVLDGGRWAFTDAVTGPPGSPVRLNIARADGPGEPDWITTIELERALVP